LTISLQIRRDQAAAYQRPQVPPEHHLLLCQGALQHQLQGAGKNSEVTRIIPAQNLRTREIAVKVHKNIYVIE